MTTWTSSSARSEIIRRAGRLGFDACGFASAVEAWPASAHLAEFIAEGRHGTMAWLADTAARRGHPSGLWPDAKTAIVLGLNYGPDRDPLEILEALGGGKSYPEIARQFRVRIATLTSHCTRIKKKLNLANSDALTRYAAKWVGTNTK